MLELSLAMAFFVGIHVGISGSRLRDRLVGRYGERVFRAGFSLLSLLGLGWLIRAYGRAPYLETWGQLAGFKPVVLALMPVAFVLLVAALTTPNPTAVGGETLLARGLEVRGVYRITRHPMLWAVSLWAALHLVVNGDLAALVLFGGLLGLCLVGTRSIDAKRRRSGGEAWASFAAVTSNLPFAAIREGRNRFVPKELLDWRLGLSLLAYLAVMHFHAVWFGVSPLF